MLRRSLRLRCFEQIVGGSLCPLSSRWARPASVSSRARLKGKTPDEQKRRLVVLQGRAGKATSSVVESWKLTKNTKLFDISVFRLAAFSIVRKNDAGASFEVFPRRVLGGFRFNGIPPRLFPIPRFLTTDETRLRNVCDLLVSRL